MAWAATVTVYGKKTWVWLNNQLSAHKSCSWNMRRKFPV
jgi:hypothetical protein